MVPPYKHTFDVAFGPIANDRVGLQIRNYRLDKKQFFADARISETGKLKQAVSVFPMAFACVPID